MDALACTALIHALHCCPNPNRDGSLLGYFCGLAYTENSLSSMIEIGTNVNEQCFPQ